MGESRLNKIKPPLFYGLGSRPLLGIFGPEFPFFPVTIEKGPDPATGSGLFSFQAGLLTPGSAYLPRLPLSVTAKSGKLCGVRPRLQRRARPGFSPGSLFIPCLEEPEKT